MEWANLAHRAIQGLHYDTHRLSELEDFINARREELRKAVIILREKEMAKALADSSPDMI